MLAGERKYRTGSILRHVLCVCKRDFTLNLLFTHKFIYSSKKYSIFLEKTKCDREVSKPSIKYIFKDKEVNRQSNFFQNKFILLIVTMSQRNDDFATLSHVFIIKNVFNRKIFETQF